MAPSRGPVLASPLGRVDSSPVGPEDPTESSVMSSSVVPPHEAEPLRADGSVSLLGATLRLVVGARCAPPSSPDVSDWETSRGMTSESSSEVAG